MCVYSAIQVERRDEAQQRVSVYSAYRILRIRDTNSLSIPALLSPALLPIQKVAEHCVCIIRNMLEEKLKRSGKRFEEKKIMPFELMNGDRDGQKHHTNHFISQDEQINLFPIRTFSWGNKDGHTEV